MTDQFPKNLKVATLPPKELRDDDPRQLTAQQPYHVTRVTYPVTQE